jgi:hypothetical protein
MKQHRDAWRVTNRGDERVREVVAAPVLQDVGHRSALHELEEYLGISEYTVQVLPQQLQGYFVEDLILIKVVRLYEDQKLAPLSNLLVQCASDNPLLVALVQGHVAYVKGEYIAALSAYNNAVQLVPSSAYLWSLVVFSLRHIGESDVAQSILANLGILVKSPTATNSLEREQRYAWAEMQSPKLAETWRFVDDIAH